MRMGVCGCIWESAYVCVGVFTCAFAYNNMNPGTIISIRSTIERIEGTITSKVGQNEVWWCHS